MTKAEIKRAAEFVKIEEGLAHARKRLERKADHGAMGLEIGAIEIEDGEMRTSWDDSTLIPKDLAVRMLDAMCKVVADELAELKVTG